MNQIAPNESMSRDPLDNTAYIALRMAVCLLLCAPSTAMAQGATQAAAAPSLERAPVLRRAVLTRDTLAAWTSLALTLRIDAWAEASRSAGAAPLSLAPVDSGPGVWKYVGWGALIGGVATGSYAAYRTRRCDGCFLTGVYIGAAAGVGALLGGFIGSLIYADRYWSHTR